MLIDKKEHPQKVYNDGNKICACCEGYSDTFIYYNKFIIVKKKQRVKIDFGIPIPWDVPIP